MARLTGLEPATPGVTGRYSNQLSYNRAVRRDGETSKRHFASGAVRLFNFPGYGDCSRVARLTGLEPATPGVTGRYSNQLSYNRATGG